jgi:hypothetical protein
VRSPIELAIAGRETAADYGADRSVSKFIFDNTQAGEPTTECYALLHRLDAWRPWQSAVVFAPDDHLQRAESVVFGAAFSQLDDAAHYVLGRLGRLWPGVAIVLPTPDYNHSATLVGNPHAHNEALVPLEPYEVAA